MTKRAFVCVVSILLFSAGCASKPSAPPAAAKPAGAIDVKSRLARYVPVRLTADLSALSANQRRLVGLLIEAAQIMDGLFWRQAYGDRDALLSGLGDDAARQYALINYGPWDRLDGNRPFLPGVGEKPVGAGFYPPDLTKPEFERAVAAGPEAKAALTSLYTLVKRDPAGALVATPYHEAFASELRQAAEKLEQAAQLAEDEGFRRYLTLRAEALLSGQYRESDLAWMDMRDNLIDVVIGPIETYEDRLFGYKAAFEGYVLIKDKAWSERLSRYAAVLPELQRGLPVDDVYKRETPGSDADLAAYDVVYYAGDCNAGSKTIAINLPNDEEVQLQKGTRRLQLKNTMKAKFDHIMAPIADLMIAAEQRRHVTFDAFFANTMFHEVAHGLGIKKTVTTGDNVRQALKEHAAALEEGKADILGLYMITRLAEKGELGDHDLMDNYVTFLAGIFRSIRFGTGSAHGVANLLRFNFFAKMGVFVRDDKSSEYRVDKARMQEAITALSRKILVLQGNGDYTATTEFLRKWGDLGEVLRADLAKIESAGVPVDIVLEKGVQVLNL